MCGFALGNVDAPVIEGKPSVRRPLQRVVTPPGLRRSQFFSSSANESIVRLYDGISSLIEFAASVVPPLWLLDVPFVRYLPYPCRITHMKCVLPRRSSEGVNCLFKLLPQWLKI